MIELIFILILSIISLTLLFMVRRYKELLKVLNKKKYVNGLTNVFRREYMIPYLKTLKQNKIKTVLLFIDIDKFKEINDKYGHDIGDEVLKRVVEILYNSIRTRRVDLSDTIIRWGGDEFLIILTDIKLKNALKVAERIRKLVNQTKIKDFNLSISIGIIEFVSLRGLVKKLDKVLYKAKKLGGNRVCILE